MAMAVPGWATMSRIVSGFTVMAGTPAANSRCTWSTFLKLAAQIFAKRTVLENSERTYVVGDSHKFLERGNYRYGKLSDFTGLVTDDHNENWRRRAAELGIEVL